MRPRRLCHAGQSYAALGRRGPRCSTFRTLSREVREAAPSDYPSDQFAALLSYALSDAGEYDGHEACDGRAAGSRLARRSAQRFATWAVRPRCSHSRAVCRSAAAHRRHGTAGATDGHGAAGTRYLLAAGIDSVRTGRENPRALARRSACSRPTRSRGHRHAAHSSHGSPARGWRAGGRDSARRDHDLRDSHGDEQGAACWALASGLRCRATWGRPTQPIVARSTS